MIANLEDSCIFKENVAILFLTEGFIKHILVAVVSLSIKVC